MKNKILTTIFARKTGLLDYYSIEHFFSGIILGLIFKFFIYKNQPLSDHTRSYFLIGLALLVLWEIIEYLFREFKEHLTSPALKAFIEYESWLNVFGDILTGMIGLTLIYFLIK